MAKQTIKIESILGGHAPTTHFASEGQFRASLGIDPAQPISDDATNAYAVNASGLLRPVPTQQISNGIISSAPMWIIPQPKSKTVYFYDLNGRTYQSNTFISAISALSSLSPSYSNGAAYYDNYVYFAKDNDVARYGPLNGSPSWNTQFWTSTLSATALSSVSYPADNGAGIGYNAHIMHRHSDNKLYIGDVSASNEGILSYIKTTRTSVEGDTNSGSTYGALKFPYGMWPTAIESYGTDLAIALYEGLTNPPGSSPHQTRAKIAFWDTTSTSYNKILYVEFPDEYISALKNINGVLYVVSGSLLSTGFRISRFVGGYTVEEVYYSETGQPPHAGAIDGTANRIIFGTITNVPETCASVYSFGLQKGALGQGLFNVMRAKGSGSSGDTVTALKIIKGTMSFDTPLIGISEGSSSNGIEKQGTTYNNAAQVWWSSMFRIGQPFQIKKIRIPLAQAMAANMTVTAKIYTDDGAGTTFTMPTMNNTNYPSARNIVLKADSSGQIPSGQHNFWLELRWTGSALCTVGLPITIEIETLDD